MLDAEPLGGGLRSFPVLKGSRSCDVLIVGGGLTGLITALRMAEKGLRTILVEARQLGCGATSACMGMGTSQLAHAYSMAANVSMEGAAVLAHLMQQTVDEIPVLLDGWKIRAGIQRRRCVLFVEQEKEQAVLEKLLVLEQRLHLPITLLKDTGDCPVPVRMAAALENQLAYEPLALFTGLIETAVRFGVSLYEHTPVRALREGVVQVEEGGIAAKHIVLATGWPIGMSNDRQLRLLQQRTWLVQRLSGGALCHHSYMKPGGDDLRTSALAYGLMAAACAGQSGLDKTQKTSAKLRSSIANRLMDWSLLQETAVQCVHSTDGLPLIGPLSRGNPRLLAAAGCGVNGLTHAVLASDMLARQILGRQLPESLLFLPFGDFHQRAAMMMNTHQQKVRRAVAPFLRDVPLCPHMGCRMRWNSLRNLWECPCHGSCFTDYGQCRCAPATEDAHIREHMRRR